MSGAACRMSRTNFTRSVYTNRMAAREGAYALMWDYAKALAPVMEQGGRLPRKGPR